MKAQTLSQLAQLHHDFSRTQDVAERRKLFAAISHLLTDSFAAEERALRGRVSLSPTEFRTSYLAARAFSELQKLELGSRAFDAKLTALCRHLGASSDAHDGAPTEQLRAA